MMKHQKLRSKKTKIVKAQKQPLDQISESVVFLPTWDLGQPLENLDISDTSAIMDFLDEGTDIYSRR